MPFTIRPLPSLVLLCALPAQAEVRIALQAPATVILPGGNLACSATVTGTADTRVAWAVWDGSIRVPDAITPQGLFTAPLAPGSRTYVIRATSLADGKAAGELQVLAAGGTPHTHGAAGKVLADAGWGDALKAPALKGRPFLDMETGERNPSESKVERLPPATPLRLQILGYGLPGTLRLPDFAARADGALLSYREGEYWMRLDGTHRDTLPLTLTGRPLEGRLELLHRRKDSAGGWTSTFLDVPLAVRGLTPFAGRDLYGPAWDAGDEDGSATAARFRQPAGMAHFGSSNQIVVADDASHVLRVVDPGGQVHTRWGQPGVQGFQDGVLEAARFNAPSFVASALQDPDLAKYSADFVVADSGNHAIRRVDAGGKVTTLAGTGQAGYRDGDGKAAQFHSPQGVAMDFHGTIYVADAGNRVIRRIDAQGVVTTFAGSGALGHADGQGAEASFTALRGLALAPRTFFHPEGGLYVVDGHAIRYVSPDREVVTVLGKVDKPGFRASGRFRAAPVRPQGRPLTKEPTPPCLHSPRGIAVEHDSLYIADEGNNALRKVDILLTGQSHFLHTLAGDPAWARTRYGLLRDDLPWTPAKAHAAIGAPRAVLPWGTSLIASTGSALVLASRSLPFPVTEGSPFLTTRADAQKAGQPLEVEIDPGPDLRKFKASGEKPGRFPLGFAWTLTFLDGEGLKPVAPPQEGRSWCGTPVQTTVTLSTPGPIQVRLTLITDEGVTFYRTKRMQVDG